MLSSKTIEIVKSTAPVLAVKGEEITTHFYKTLFSNHPELLNIFNHAKQKKGRQQTALANTVYAAATYIDQLEVLIPAVKQIAHKHRSLSVKPEHYPIVGEHLLEAIKAVLGDAATEEIIEAWGEAYGVIADVFISVEKEMYEAAAQQHAGWEDFKDFEVVEKVEESELITSFYLKPSDGSAVPSFTPGQYITIRFSIPGEKNLFNRQYSLSDASNGECFRISVKKENGDYSTARRPLTDDRTLEDAVPAVVISGKRLAARCSLTRCPLRSVLQWRQLRRWALRSRRPPGFRRRLCRLAGSPCRARQRGRRGRVR
jgi:nitric oxide dioxygenase